MEIYASIIDFDHPEKNDFLAINQFRVDVDTWEKKADETLAEDFVGPAIL